MCADFALPAWLYISSATPEPEAGTYKGARGSRAQQAPGTRDQQGQTIHLLHDLLACLPACLPTLHRKGGPRLEDDHVAGHAEVGAAAVRVVALRELVRDLPPVKLALERVERVAVKPRRCVIAHARVVPLLLHL